MHRVFFWFFHCTNMHNIHLIIRYYRWEPFFWICIFLLFLSLYTQSVHNLSWKVTWMTCYLEIKDHHRIPIKCLLLFFFGLWAIQLKSLSNFSLSFSFSSKFQKVIMRRSKTSLDVSDITVSSDTVFFASSVVFRNVNGKRFK